MKGLGVNEGLAFVGRVEFAGRAERGGGIGEVAHSERGGVDVGRRRLRLGSHMVEMKEISIQGRSNYNEKRSEDVMPNGEGERGQVRASEDRLGRWRSENGNKQREKPHVECDA